jgi:hypothetical protein
MARCVALLAALVLLAGTATAYAEAPKPSIYNKPQMAIFEEGDEVLVDLPDFGDTMIAPRVGSRFPSLIQIREDFIPELTKACEDL